MLVRSRLAQGRGRRGIAAELESLGIDADGVEALAAADDDAGEVDRALALLDRKPPRAKNRRDAAYRRLAQKGFSASVSSSAARLWCEANACGGGAALHFRLFLVRAFTIRAQPLSYGIA